MKALLCHAFGPPSALALGDLPTPDPGPAQVRLRVEACGVNFADVLLVRGAYQAKPPFPFAPGGEVCGVVDAVGPDVSTLSLGQRVTGMCSHGGMAQHVIVDAPALVAVPDGVPPASAAALSYAYGTTLHALRDRALLRPGETLLVLGAGGGAGQAAVQIGRLLGARVIAAASPAKLGACTDADARIDYTAEGWRNRVKALAPDGVDVVYDPVGGTYAEPALRSLGWAGRYLVVGFAAGEIPRVPLNLTLLKGSAILGVFYGTWAKKQPAANAALMAQLLEWVAGGRLQPRVTATYPLDRAADALAALADRRVTGKLVVTVG